MYAVFQEGGRQYTVSEGDQIELDYRGDVPVGNQIELERVLLFHGPKGYQLGTPTLPSAKIVADVLDHGLSEKIYVQKMHRRKGYRRRTGHRQNFTRVRIRQIVVEQPS